MGGELVRARDLCRWELHIEREYLGGPLRSPSEPARVRVAMVVEFDNDAAAVEFESPVRRMLPEPG